MSNRHRVFLFERSAIETRSLKKSSNSSKKICHYEPPREVTSYLLLLPAGPAQVRCSPTRDIAGRMNANAIL